MRRLLLVVLILAPLPVVAGMAVEGNARTVPRPVVSARDGDLFVGAEDHQHPRE